MVMIFWVILWSQIREFSYSEIVRLFAQKLDSSFAQELQLHKMVDSPKHPDINLQLYAPLKTYTQDVTFFPVFSSPILLKNQNTHYGFQLKIGNICPYFDIYARLEGYDNYFISNVYSPTKQQYIYGGIGIRRDFLRPDKNSISWLLEFVVDWSIQLDIAQKKNEMLFDFKKTVMNYLLYREKIRYETEIMNLLAQIDTIVSKEWIHKVITPEEYFNFKLTFLSVYSKFKDDSLNYIIQYEKIKLIMGVTDSIVITEDTFALEDVLSILPTQPYIRDIKFVRDSLKALAEYYNGLLKCSNVMPGLSFGFEIGGKGVITSEGVEEKLLPSIVNIGVILNFSSLSSINCKKICKSRLENKLSKMRQELFIRNKERILHIERYKENMDRYIHVRKELENLLAIAKNDPLHIKLETFRTYLTMYEEILSKIYFTQLELEKIRSEFL
uniref:TolC family protein n=1 Tax=candidate division WOR-3 bacterium TaxID=2052148 RepID=A0A7V3ZYN7_UNCW3